MKNLALTLFFIFILLKTNCQNYIQFPTHNARWSSTEQFMDLGNPNYSYEYYKTNGDTLINGFQYTIIDRNDFPKYCFIRDKNGFVYCKYSNNSYIDTTEFLLYNFNLLIGDTIQIPMAGYEIHYYKGHVVSVDSILVGKIYHKRIGINTEGWDPFEFIEGIGSLQGLLYPENPWVDWMVELTCFSQNDTIFDLTGNGVTSSGECWQTVNIKERKSSKSTIFPNPTKGLINITGQKVDKSELYTISGQKILETKLNKFNLEKYNNGVYLLKIYYPDESFENIKIIKKE